MKDFSSLIADLSAQVTHTDFDKCVPTFATIREVQKKIEENAGCIDCSLPNTGTFAHIWLTKSPEEWTRLTNLPQVQEPQLPNRPTIPNSATAARIKNMRQQKRYTAKLRHSRHFLLSKLSKRSIPSTWHHSAIVQPGR